MIFKIRLLLLGIVLVFTNSTPICIERPPANRRNFIACPVVHDTKTMPCWLAEYEGEIYYLGQQGSVSTEFYPPQLLHKVLVEGTITEGVARVCGGIPLEPVKISVLQELNRSCNTILPVEEGFEPPKPIPVPQPPRFLADTRKFTVNFTFDSDFLTLHKTRIIEEAVRIAKLANAQKIEVIGYRASTLLSNGQKLIEKENLGKIRADKIGEILAGLGLPKKNIQVKFISKAEKADGVSDSENRRVTIEIE